MPADIQVSVRFQDQCVFAGEEVKCTITFKNVASTSEPQTPGPHRKRSSRTLSIEKLSATSPRFSDVLQSPRVGKANYPPSAMKRSMGSATSAGGIAPPQRPGHKHQRSVSIISIGSPTVVQEGGNEFSARPGGGHRRSSTIQVHTGHDRQPSQNRGLSGLQIPSAGGRRSPLSSTSASTPVYESRGSTPDFQFPPSSQGETGTQVKSRDQSREPSPRLGNAASSTTRRDHSTASRVTSERSSAEFYSLSNHSQETLVSEQPSVMSDRPQLQIPSAMMRRHYRMDSMPQTPRRPPPQPINLMMGYAHLAATFTVDASLVDQSPFEEVKQKGFLGGQAGGGVVGVTQKKARPTSGFLGGFNFNSIGDSLTQLVGGDSSSSVREMNAVSNARAIPLLSTPQSLLFVNLHLEPGEEKSYSFTCPIPRGLPSSYRGKAIKISYNILVGVQSAPTSSRSPDHKVRQISIPVRVFSGVDSEGETLGHDLMQPHVLLRDPARTKSISTPFIPQQSDTTSDQPSKYDNSAALQSYINSLLSRPKRRHSSTGSLYDPTPSLTAAEQHHPTLALINRAILLSSHRHLNPNTNAPTNRFNITRATQPVAVIILSRPLLKLGETLHVAIALAPQHTTRIRTVSVHCSLETIEKVAQSLAVRSAASIARVTRKVHASWGGGGGGGGCVLNGRRVVWGVSVPSGAGTAPGFVTTGVGLEWGIRVEFGVLRDVRPEVEQDDISGADEQNRTAVDEDEQNEQQHDLLHHADRAARSDETSDDDDPSDDRMSSTERRAQPQIRKTQPGLSQPQTMEAISTDPERGTLAIAVERLECESFEVTIPITVYGDVLPMLDGKDEGREVVKEVGL